MRLHRFFTNADVSGKKVFLSEEESVHKIMHVLRLSVGDEAIFCKDGYDARVRIKEISKKGIHSEVLSLQKNVADPDRHITLYCGMLKKENFEFVVQKAVEAGVSEIVPLKTKRIVKTGISEDRLKKIAREAAEQCGRAWIPVIRESIEFSNVVSVIPSEAMEQSSRERKRISHSMSSRAKRSEVEGSTFTTATIFFDASGENARDFFQNKKMKDASVVNIFIGPEGGWDAEEVAAAKKAGFFILSLGPRILRAETAAIIGSFLAAWV